MLKGLNIVELAQKIQAQAEGKKDFIAEARSLELVPRVNLDSTKGKVGESGRVVRLAVDGQGQFDLNDVAHQQLATYTEIPGRYYDRMRREDPALLATNANRWLRDRTDKRMVRTIGPTARALLSNSYQRVDNYDVAQKVLPILLSDQSIKVVSSEVTDRRLYIQAVNTKVEGEVLKSGRRVGDLVNAGVVISNSEVGAGQASVTAMLWRLTCLNGAKFNNSKFGIRHIGRAIDNNEALYSEETRKLDDRANLSKLADMVKAALEEVTFQKRLERLEDLSDPSRALKRPADAIQVLANELELGKQDQANILDALIKGGDLTPWGVVNAVTFQAHSAGDYDRAVEWEEMGGKLIEAPAGTWKKIIDAEFTEVKPAA